MRKKAISILILCLMLTSNAVAARGEIEIIINIPAFKLHVYEGGIRLKSYPISIGKELNPSILGKTSIINKVANPTYYPPGGGTPIPPGPDNPVGTRWLGLDFPGYGIHGTNNPSSIGSAASLGCIRMLNSDVEELTNFVKVGTSVQLIYQTILLEEDPLLHTKTITVFADIYKQGVTPGQLERELGLQDWGTVYQPALITMLRSPTGRAQPLPWAIPLYLEDEALDFVGVEWGGQQYLPWDLPFDPRLDFANELVKWEDNYFLPLEIYVDKFGLGYEKTQGGWKIQRPTAYLDDHPLGKALVYDQEIYILASTLPKRVSPEKIPVLLFWGESYYPRSLFSEKGEGEITLLLGNTPEPVTGE